ncbi:DsrE/DsrF/DrsH-like family protein [Oscillochloris sp. ZM17-4]|uniref:DsrE/DsrF/DrsH-like family protein n=1 Tax=Oscillochloris sp. ZM17-4 TaxID=2866714 RepID=UPI001C732AAB|nr:DsrE/DsrF/DrsH-like family protein [Oscillochloris sp. ZM17-4]MBX0330924.1 DsrE/DsrF/DrsH-like family protein [Oscillochloris sp. ZM17-4]
MMIDTPEMGTEALLARIAELEQRVSSLEETPAQSIEDRVSMVVFSGELDKAIAAFIIATGAASMGLEVNMFFTFWGIGAVRKREKVFAGKNLLEKGFTAMLPSGTGQLGLSQMNFLGAGAQLIRKIMKDRDISSVEELFEMSRELGVRMVVCDMSRELMGIADSELIDGLETGGVATFMADAARSKVTLFI